MIYIIFVRRHLYPATCTPAAHLLTTCFFVSPVILSTIISSKGKNVGSHMLEQGVGQASDVNQAGLTRDRNGCTQTTTGRQLWFRISCGAAHNGVAQWRKLPNGIAKWSCPPPGHFPALPPGRSTFPAAAPGPPLRSKTRNCRQQLCFLHFPPCRFLHFPLGAFYVSRRALSTVPDGYRWLQMATTPGPFYD